LSAGEVTPLEVVDDVLAAIERRDGDIGAYLEVFGDDARAAARDAAASGAWRTQPLGGIPVALKDNICVAGKRTSCASRMLENYVSPYDATVVERLRGAGAIVLGRTNLDEFAMGSSTENSALARTRNPWDAERVPGGSSGGSAAAVAAHMAPAALGSDTGGSIRQPAGYCGVVGLKPTYGRVSRYGLVAFASSLDQIGPITRSVEDAALVLTAIAGRDDNDATSLSAPVPGPVLPTGDDGLAGLTVGVPRAFLADALDAEVRANFDATVERIEAAGATTREVTLAHASYAVATYYIIANAEASANLARFDGVRYGHRSERADDLYTMYTRTRDEGFGAEVKRRILLGTWVLSAGYHDAYYLQAQKVRSLIIRDFADAFSGCDLITLPTAPSPAFRVGEKIDDPVQMYLTDIFTIPVNLAGLPAISLPSGLSREGLPLGVQLIAPALGEETLLRGARSLEAAIGFEGFSDG
jgi:aspartyl-tRNA(Asn)/glutamyl-tRNA(Gln) amidotransferase subunit A